MCWLGWRQQECSEQILGTDGGGSDLSACEEQLWNRGGVGILGLVSVLYVVAGNSVVHVGILGGAN